MVKEVIIILYMKRSSSEGRFFKSPQTLLYQEGLLFFLLDKRGGPLVVVDLSHKFEKI